MQKERPTLLPGKELYGVHFNVLSCARSGEETLKREIKPLLTLAGKKGWIQKEEVEGLLEKVAGRKECGELWREGAALWAGKINRHNPEEGPALAGWHVLHNLEKARGMWRGYRRPYPTLFAEKERKRLLGKLRVGMLLAKAFEEHLPAEEKDEERHLLGIIVCLRQDPEEMEEMNVQTLNGDALAKSETPRFLLVSHGMKKGGPLDSDKLGKRKGTEPETGKKPENQGQGRNRVLEGNGKDMKRHHILWSAKEKAKLAELIRVKTPMREIIRILKKTEKSIRRKCDRMGLSSATIYEKKKTRHEAGVSPLRPELEEKESWS